jgi:general secretion pathway protein H
MKKLKKETENGFTLLEMIVVVFLITLILGISTPFFINSLSSGRFNATTREISATIRYARSLAQIQGERKIITIDLDAKNYTLEGYRTKDIPSDINVKVIDPLLGEIQQGKYQIVVDSIGHIEGGTIVLWNNKKKATIQPDPIVGTVVIK